jgi:hypothetical protein
MAYKFTTGSVRKGDIYFEDDRLGEPTYIDFGMDTITLRPSGAAQLYVEDGKVGIGTTAPDHTLHVKSPGTCHVKIESEAGDEAALKIKSGGQSSAYIWQPGSTSDLRFYINGDDVMHLDSNGNIGIGVTDPDTLLEVAGAAHLSGEIATPSAPADGDGGILYTKTDGKVYWISHELSETDLTSGGGGGGGISFNGSTANGVVTYGSSTTADVESNLLFNGSKLSVAGDVSGSGGLEAVGAAVLGGALNVSGAVTLGTLTSGSAAGPSSFLAVDTSGIIKLDEPTVTAALPDKHVQGLTLTYIDDDNIQIGTGECRNIANDADMTLASVQNIDITAVGINGRDTADAVTDVTWYSIWLVSGASGTGGLYSTSTDSPTLPAGYDVSKRRIGWIRTYQTLIPVFAQTGGTRERTMYWGEASGFYILHSAVSDTTGWQTDYSMAAGTAPTAHTMLVTMQATAGGNSAISFRWQGYNDMGAGFSMSQVLQNKNQYDPVMPLPCIDNSGVNMNMRIKTWGSAKANIRTAGWIETI